MDLHNNQVPREGARACVRGEPSEDPRRQAGAPPGGSALDNITKSTSARDFVDHETGEIFSTYDPTLKWQLQAVAKEALLGSKHRIRICHRHIRHDWNEVQVRRSIKSGKPYYAGLMVCGSVWVCPVCAAKIQSVRAAEVRSALDTWQELGGFVVMLTQTVPHTKQDNLSDLLQKFTKALMNFKGQRAYTRACNKFEIHGSIRALEVTHGDNGWHPHAHTILFLKNQTEFGEMQAQLFPLWKNAVLRTGLGKPSKNAFTVRNAGEVRTYITKMGSEYTWNAEHELVKSHTKSGRDGGLSPFDMLRSYNVDPDDGRMWALFAEYAWTFHGRRQLVWSNGLKKELLNTEGLSDQQIAESIGELDEILANITLEQWSVIRKNRLQGLVLQNVQDFGYTGLLNLLLEYSTPVKTAPAF